MFTTFWKFAKIMQTPRPAHHLKTWPEYFSAVKSGHKAFEVRRRDRDFKVTDAVLLKEWDQLTGKFTGNAVAFRIAYILDDFEGLKPGYCAMTIRPVDYYLPGDVVKVQPHGNEDAWVVLQGPTGPEGKSGKAEFYEIQNMESGRRLTVLKSDIEIA